jgi:hypothetical protein
MILRNDSKAVSGNTANLKRSRGGKYCRMQSESFAPGTGIPGRVQIRQDRNDSFPRPQVAQEDLKRRDFALYLNLSRGERSGTTAGPTIP